MALTQINLGSFVTWQLARSVTGFTDVTQGPETASFSSSTLDVATWSEVFAAQYTLAASGTQNVDLRSFTDLAGNSVTGTKAMAILVLVTGATTGVLNVKRSGTNGLQWFFESASFGVNIPGGGMFMFSEGATSAGTTVDATNRQILLTNTGAVSLTVKVVALVSTL